MKTKIKLPAIILLSIYNTTYPDLGLGRLVDAACLRKVLNTINV
jgi:hypothetical protein